MTLIDSNIVIYASDHRSPLHDWALQIISAAGASDGAVVIPVILAEVLVGAASPESIFSQLRKWWVGGVDLPEECAVSCAAAYMTYRKRRREQTGHLPPPTPLPDFFIGAHAEVMGWDLATADKGRFSTYFPSVRLITPY